MTEKDIEDLIMGALKNEGSHAEMKKRGFPIFQKGRAEFYRQVRINNHGIADIVAIGLSENEDGKIKPCITVYELKRDSVGSVDIEQVTRYASAIMVGIGGCFQDYYSELSGESLKINEEENYDVNLVLIGSSCDFVFNGALAKNSNLHFYTYNIDAFKGISFEEQIEWYSGFNGCDESNWVSADFAEGLERMLMSLSVAGAGMICPAESDQE